METNQLTFIAHVRKVDKVQQPLCEHLLGTGALAERAADKINLSSAGKLMGFMHDFGKFNEVFQNYIKSAVGLLNPDVDGEHIGYSSLSHPIKL